MPTDADSQPDNDRVSYATFGARFFEHAVTESRIVGALDGIAGDPIEFIPESRDTFRIRRAIEGIPPRRDD